jgi:hypothetical protein
MLQSGRLRVRNPMKSLKFFNLPNPSSRGVYSASNRSEYRSTKKFLWSRARPARNTTGIALLFYMFFVYPMLAKALVILVPLIIFNEKVEIIKVLINAIFPTLLLYIRS